jgi:DNA-binding transcriptional LysR family regulator
MSRKPLRRFFRHGLLPQLLVFEAVARLGSVTRAAENLHLAQPTVSLQIKKLAAALEVDLFTHSGRRLHLTAAGYVLQDISSQLIALLGRTEERLSPWRVARLDAPRPGANNPQRVGGEESPLWTFRATTTPQQT